MRLIPTSPKALGELLVSKNYDFVKPAPAKNLLRLVLGDGLVVVEGDVHKFQRKNINPTFSFRHIKDLYPVMWAKSVEMVRCIWATEPESSDEGKSGWRVLEANQWASRATLDIIGMAALGREFNTLNNSDDELVQVYEWLFKPTKAIQFWFAANLILPRWIAKYITWTVDQEVTTRGARLRQLSREFVRSKREAMKGETTQSVDTLAHLIRTNNFSDDELVAQVLTFLAAGFVLSIEYESKTNNMYRHETTSGAFTWTLYFLAKYPKYQEILRKELQDAAASYDPASLSQNLPSFLETAPYLNAITAEVFRFHPSIPGTMRRAAKDTTINSYPIPKGTDFVIPSWQLGRCNDLWGPRAGEFWPERWLDGLDEEGGQHVKFNNHGGGKSNYAFLVFSHGPRSCIGQGFARAELRNLVAAWVLAFEFVMDRPEEEIIPFGPVAVKPKNGLYLKVRPVSGEGLNPLYT